VNLSVQDLELLTYPFCQQFKEEAEEANARHLSDIPLSLLPTAKR